MNVPFVDLRAQHDELRDEIDAALKEAVDRSAFIGGPAVEAFETRFGAYCGSQFALGCASGTDALKLALMGVGVKPGDAVITVPNTFIASVEAISLVGAQPTFVDVEPSTYTMSIASLQCYLETGCRRHSDGRLTDKASGRPVTAVVPVHLYGFPADMAPILAAAEKHHLKVVEDACQAHGVVYHPYNSKPQKAGSVGHAGAFSFYPGKNLGAMGEAGAVTTNDPQVARGVRVWRDHGQHERYVHVSPDGWNARLDAIQAAVLSIKLRRLDEWNERRRQVADWYRELLGGDDRITLPVELPYGRHVYHLYVIRVPERGRVREGLASRGISTALHYPIPLHLQDAYRHLGLVEGTFPESEAAARSVLSLPMYPHLTRSQVEYVCAALGESLDALLRVRALGG